MLWNDVIATIYKIIIAAICKLILRYNTEEQLVISSVILCDKYLKEAY